MRIMLLLALFMGAGSANAWDADVHYGLTKWLAFKAGFTPEDAETIAQADWCLDKDPNRAALPVMVKRIILGGGDAKDLLEASDQIRWDHFRSKGKPGLDPEYRSVVRDTFSRDTWKDACSKPKNVLSTFGEALHAYQDSWSHEGVPDVPLRPFVQIHLQYAWSHPRTRGSWYSHRADITPTIIGKDRQTGELSATQMARRTFDQLRELCKDPAIKCSSPLADWKGIQDEVAGFVDARTLEGKKKWFRDGKRGLPFPDLAFVDDTDLPQTEYQIDEQRLNQYSQSRQGAATMLVALADTRLELAQANIADLYPQLWGKGDCKEASFSGFVQSFIVRWTATGGTDEGLIKDIHVPAIDQQLEIWLKDAQAEAAKLGARLRVSRVPSAEDWIRVYLRMWFARDHGVIEKYGHGIPVVRGYAVLEDNLAHGPAKSSGFELMKEGRTAAYAGSGQPFGIFEVTDDRQKNAFGLCGVTFGFKDRLKGDALMLFAGKVGSDWKFVRLGWIAMGGGSQPR